MQVRKRADKSSRAGPSHDQDEVVANDPPVVVNVSDEEPEIIQLDAEDRDTRDIPDVLDTIPIVVDPDQPILDEQSRGGPSCNADEVASGDPPGVIDIADEEVEPDVIDQEAEEHEVIQNQDEIDPIPVDANQQVEETARNRKSRTGRKHVHSEKYIQRICNQYPDLRRELIKPLGSDTKVQKFYCQTCRNAYGRQPPHAQWIFASGFVDGKKMESEELKKHFTTHAYHKTAMSMLTTPKLTAVIEKPLKLSSIEKAQYALLIEDLHLVAKTDKPITFIPTLLKHFDSKIKLLSSFEQFEESAKTISNNLESAKTLQRYNKIHCALTSLATVAHKVQLEKLIDNLFWSFTCDGTLRAGQEIEVMLVMHEKQSGKSHELTFVKSTFLDNLTADGEVEFIRISLGPITEGVCVSFCIDGPTKHTGWRNGVIAKLEMKQSAVICTPHTGDLVKQHLSKSNSDVKPVIQLLRGIAGDLNDFYKKKSYIEATKALGRKFLNYITFPETRWSYIAQVCLRHISVFDILVMMYENLASTDVSLKGRLSQLLNLKYHYTISVVGDIFCEMQKQIILKHQADNALVCEVDQDVKNLRTFLEMMKVKLGKLEKRFWDDLVIDLTDVDDHGPKYCLVNAQGRTISMGLGHMRTRDSPPSNVLELKEKLSGIKLNIIDDVIDDSDACFDKRQSNIKKWGAFDIRMFPQSENLAPQHFKEEIQELASYYGSPFNVLKSDGSKAENFVNPPIVYEDQVVIEYYSALPLLRDRFQEMISKRDVHLKRKNELDKLNEDQDANDHQNPDLMIFEEEETAKPGISQREAWVEFLTNYSEVYPNLCTLVRIMLVTLTNSAPSERYFSWLESVISGQRQSTDLQSTVQALSAIKYNCPEKLNNQLIEGAVQEFEKKYNRNYKCSNYRL